MTALPPGPTSPTQEIRPISPLSKKPNKSLPAPTSAVETQDSVPPPLPQKVKKELPPSEVRIVSDSDILLLQYLTFLFAQISPPLSRSASQKSEQPEDSEEIQVDKLKAKQLLKRAHEAKVEIDETNRKLQEELQEAEQAHAEGAELRREALELKRRAQKEVGTCLFFLVAL